MINPFKNLKRSLISLLAEEAIKLSDSKKRYVDPETFAKYIDKMRLANEKSYVPPLRVKTQTRDFLACGMQCFELCDTAFPTKTIVYIHGGAYVEQPLLFHWLFLDKIATEAQCRALIPLYPLAPVHTVIEAIAPLIELYAELLKTTCPENIILAGDSAGAGLALALAMELRRQDFAQPKELILICPWLDITLSNPEVALLADVDPMLGAYGLIEAGKMWSGELNQDSYLLSPINGDFHNLAPITLFTGTHELFWADSKLLRDKLRDENIPLLYYEYPEMNHVFPMFPVPEARLACEQILSVIKRKI